MTARPRIYVVVSPVTAGLLDRLDRDAAIIVLTQPAIRMLERDAFERFLLRRSMAVVIARGAVEDRVLATALSSDFFALAEDSSLNLANGEWGAAVAAGLLWRIGRRALPLLLSEGTLDAERAEREGLCDFLVPKGTDSLEWFRSWIRGRSIPALQSAAALLRLQSNDRIERAEFSRLFAAGVPQDGLERFLKKMPLELSDEVMVETI